MKRKCACDPKDGVCKYHGDMERAARKAIREWRKWDKTDNSFPSMDWLDAMDDLAESLKVRKERV